MPILNKDGVTCTANKDQVAAMVEAGWETGEAPVDAPDVAPEEAPAEVVADKPVGKRGRGK